MHSLIRLCLHPLAGGKGGQSCRISACALGRGWWLFFFFPFFSFFDVAAITPKRLPLLLQLSNLLVS